MATLIDSKINPGYKAVLVQRGDTLSQIAVDYGNGLTYRQLAGINNIPNPNLIYVGQVIELVSSTTGDIDRGSTIKATISQFGMQSNSENTLFATWAWNKPNTENYKVEWTYDTGDDVWFIGSDSTTEHMQSTYSIPNNATRVRFRVKPISKTKTSNDNETSYWTASWSSYKIHNVSDNPPKKPSTPSVEIENTYVLTAELSNLDVNATQIQFMVVKDDTSIFKTAKADIVTTKASFSCNVDAGSKYKVRCRSCRGNLNSEWSDYSENVSTAPAASSGITEIKATSKTSVYLAWGAAGAADSYEIEYATKKEYLDNTNMSTTQAVENITHYTIYNLDTGYEYFFRVRAVNEKGKSPWSAIKSVIIGKTPAPPTTWSSTTTLSVGDPLIFYWVHNSEDGSSQSFAQLQLIFSGNTDESGEAKILTIENKRDEDDKDKTSSYEYDTSAYIEGVTIKWRVRTAGVIEDDNGDKAFGEWSVERTVNVYAPPTLALSFTTKAGDPIETLTAFPATVKGVAGPNTQAPIGYLLSVVSNEVYETIDAVGNTKIVNKGEEVYSKYIDINEVLEEELSADNIDLENNINYTIKCRVSMNSGLTAENTLSFDVSWSDESYEPNAEISVDKETLIAYIRPYCQAPKIIYYRVDYSNSTYTATTTKVNILWGEMLSGVKTTDGKQVYSGILANGTELYYYMETTGSLVDDVTLSVYRREYDGRFIEIATGLKNSNNTCVIDPHPALDFARYRIIARSDATGAISFADIRGLSVEEKAVIIQWSEDWTDFEANSEDALAQPAWSGSLLRLPYNVDVSDNRKPDVALVEYIGRSHPISYYGTQIGETATWSMDIAKDDKETLYALRRLAIWMGDVYVREPSGSGYWANISVSFSQKHCDTIIPVTLDIVRVEGGM